MKKWARFMIPAIILIVVAVVLLVIFRPTNPTAGLQGTMTEAANDELQQAVQIAGVQETAESQERLGFVQSEELILYLANSDFITGETSQMGYTVLYGDRVAGDISLVDDAGKTVATLANDGSGRIEGEISFREEEERIGSLHAVCGGSVSREIKIYVHPRIDNAMMDRLYDVAKGVGDYVLSLNSEDPGRAEVLQKVEAYLNGNPQVAQAALVDGTVFYVTKDGLVGSYNMGLPEIGMMGTSIADDAYESVLYEDNKHLHDTFIPSDLVLTNGKLLIIAPQAESDGGIKVHSYAALGMLKQFENTINGQMMNQGHSYGLKKASAVACKEDEARLRLLQGDYLDCGMLVLNMHGEIKTFDNNRKLLLLTLGTFEALEDLNEGLISDEFRDDFWLNSTGGNDYSVFQQDTRAVLDTTVNVDGQSVYSVRLSTSFFEHVLANKMFDNTIVYLAICSGMADESFPQLLLNHGASVVIGYKKAAYFSYSLLALSEITQSMVYADESGIYGTAKAGNSVLSEGSVHTLKHFLDMIDEEESTLIQIGFAQTYLNYQEKVNQGTQNSSDTKIPDHIKNRVAKMPVSERIHYMEEQFLSDYRETITENNPAVFAYRNKSIGSLFVVAGSGDVSGRVVCELTDHQKTPMTEAELKFYRWFNHAFEEDTRFRTKVKADGTYAVEKLPYGIWAIESQYGDIKAFTTLEHHTGRCNAPDVEFCFELTGRVMQPDEHFTMTSCVGALVTLESLDGNNVVQSSQTTDASGYYCFLVPPGNYQITAFKDNQTKSVQMKVDAESLILNDAKKAEAEAEDIVFGTIVSGYVVDEVTGDPMSGVLVDFGNDELPAQITDEKGYWSIHLPHPGRLAIHFTREDYKDEEVHTGVIDGNHSFTQEMTPLGKRITGFVTDQKTGEALYDVTVTCSDGVHTYTAATEYDGTFILEKVLPGDYELIFAKSGYVTAQMSAHHGSDAYTALDQLMLKPEGYVVFGRFRQTKGGGVRDIEWDVLEKDVANRRALLISHYGLYPIAYNDFDDVSARQSTTWETCSLRAWLNNEFLNEAFNKEEQAAIRLTDIDNSPGQGYRVGDIEEVSMLNYWWDTTGGNDTQDKIFVLSYAEAQKYYQTDYVEVSVFDDPNKGACIAARVSPTDYTAKYIQESYRFLTEEGKPTTSWWLRSPGRYQSDALTIAPSGVVQIDTHVNWNKTVVRPAMWVDLSVIDGLEQTEKLSGDSFKK